MTRKISRLCLKCPNFNRNWPDPGPGNCKGSYTRDDQNACLTFKSWKGGKLTFHEALRAKRNQHHRHKTTDEFRRNTRKMILNHQQSQREGIIREQADFLATRIAKGENAFKVAEKAKEWTNLFFPRKLCRAIEENRRRMVRS